MKIHNVRLGHACNSSSTHSIVILPKPVPDHNIDVMDSSYYFGWDFFTASSVKAKVSYLSAIFHNSLPVDMPEYIKEHIIDSVFDGRYSNVDHQSLFCLPKEFGSDCPSQEFFDEFMKYFLDPRVTILGGNDNTCEEHPLLADSSEFPMPQLYGDIIARKDHKYDYWTLYNRESGDRIRFSFQDGAIEPKRSTVPELVDIKINDYCPFNCDFCYQGSTASKGHARLDLISGIANTLENHQVFEVALGGGEPTLHPDFGDIIDIFTSRNIVVNFTTKNKEWLLNHNYLIDKCGSFAYSVSEIDDLKGLPVRDAPLRNKIVIQMVMGVVSREEFNKIMNYAEENYLRVVLLGFKNNNRGASFNKVEYKSWLFDDLKKHSCRSVGIDTVLANECIDDIRDCGIPKVLYELNEGTFSMYIDAMNEKCAESSYCSDDKYIPFNHDLETTFQEIFEKKNGKLQN